MAKKPMSTDPGPPVWKALPELINKPAPIAPPLQDAGQSALQGSVWSLHGNHLHVSALQITMKYVLAGGRDRIMGLWVV